MKNKPKLKTYEFRGHSVSKYIAYVDAKSFNEAQKMVDADDVEWQLSGDFDETVYDITCVNEDE